METEQDNGTNMENSPEDIKGQETESTDIDGTSGDQVPRTTSYENAGKGEDEKSTEITQNEGEEKIDQSPGTARNEEVNPGDINDPKTAEKEIDKTSGDKAFAATANESESMPGENMSPSTAANTFDKTSEDKAPLATAIESDKTSEDKLSPDTANERDNPGDNKNPVTAEKEIDKTSEDKAHLATANESDKTPEDKASPDTAYERDNPGDNKDPVTAEKEIDKTSEDKAPLATANESDKTSEDKASPDTANERDNQGDNKDPVTAEKEIDKTSEDKASLATANESDKTSEDKASPDTANESDKTSEDKASPDTANERDNPGDNKDPVTAEKEIDKTSEDKASLATANESDKTSEDKASPDTANESDKTSEDKASPDTANERDNPGDNKDPVTAEKEIDKTSDDKAPLATANESDKTSEDNTSPDTANESDKTSGEKASPNTENEFDKTSEDKAPPTTANESAVKGEEGKSTVKTPNKGGDTNGEGRHTKKPPSQDDGNVIKRKQSKDSKNREKLKQAERKLEEAEQNINALTQSLDNAIRQVEEAVKSRDEAEERLIKKVKEHAKLVEDNWNFEKENLHLKKSGKEQKDEIDRLKTETNEQSKRIDTLQKTISKKNQNQELMKNKHQAELERERKTHEKQKQHLQQLVDENKRLKWFEKVYPSLQHENQQLNSNLQIAERKQNRDKETIQALSKQNESLHEEKQELLLRLSKIAGANLTLNNPNIADLSDDKRPTKLAEEFSELYDNEWTDAFEVIEIKEERDKTTYMLLLLQRASDICREISDTHIHDIKKGLCHMTFRTKSISAEEVTTSITEPTANECQEGKNNDQSQSDDDFIMINIDKTNENSEQDSDELKTQQIVHTGASNENSGSKYTLNNEGSPETPGENDDEESLDDTKASLEDKMNVDSKQEDLQTNLAKEYETCKSLSDINDENPDEKQNTNTNNMKDELTQGNEQNEETPADQDALQPTVTAEPMQNNAQAPLAGTATQIDTEREQTQLHPLVTCLTDEDTKQANEHLSEMSLHGGSKGEPHVQEAQKDSNGHLSSDVGSKARQNVNQSVSRVTREDGSRVQSNSNEPSEVGYSENGNAQIPPTFTDVTDTSTQTDSEKNPTQLHQSVLGMTVTENKQAHTDASIDITTHDRFKAEHNVNQSVSGESEENGNGDDKQTGQNPKVEYSELVNEIKFEFDSLGNDQKKTVMELRKFIEIKVSHQIEKDVANAIAAENKIDDVKDEMIVKYIKKCVNVCWSMCRHEPPVYIEFHDIQGDQKFDSNVFKPYTKSGKHLHYVVWPALLLHKDGPMLCKGVAQGR